MTAGREAADDLGPFLFHGYSISATTQGPGLNVMLPIRILLWALSTAHKGGRGESARGSGCPVEAVWGGCAQLEVLVEGGKDKLI